jgi:PEP-CTERM motif-containing protein
MRTHTASLTILCLALAAVPVAAQDLYDNGPINGTTDAWTINFGYVVDDSFTLANNSTVGGFNFGVWESAGDRMTSVDWFISSHPNGGTVYGSGTASGKNLTDQFISVNQYGYDIDKITVTGLNVPLSSSTTYWLNLENAMVPSGNPVYWDENSGAGCGGDDGHGGGCPSMGSEGGIGSVSSEAFTIDGTGGGTTPEPGSFVLFASGILGLAGVLRRKLR